MTSLYWVGKLSSGAPVVLVDSSGREVGHACSDALIDEVRCTITDGHMLERVRVVGCKLGPLLTDD